MNKVILTKRDGEKTEIEYTPGLSLMLAISNVYTPDPFAICGGCCSCATCHVYVTSSNEHLPPINDDEIFLLEDAGVRTENSRLSCQIIMTPELDGLEVTVAPEH
ncbi:MAG: ferredoxin [Pseudomonadales bacterium]|nr:ferredoxin [Pseudomonadales bacterium]RLU02980.1 MAG: ferredoxin [Ketobacter sp.]